MKLIKTLLPILFIAVAAFPLTGQAQVTHGKPTRGSGIQPEVLYHNYCSVCHGDRGDGNSRAAVSLNPPPKNFFDTHNLTRDYMIAIIAEGKGGTAMPGWGTQLSKKEIEGVTDYIRSTFMAVVLDPKIMRGREVYLQNCQICHGPRGEGQPNPQAGMPTAPKNFATPAARAELPRERMIDAVYNGKSGTAMISYRDKIKKADIANVVDYIRAMLMIPESKISGTQAHGGREQDAGKTSFSAARADMSQGFANNLKGDARKGKAFFDKNCADCHGVKGDGKGPRAYFINPRPAVFTSEQKRSTLNRPAIFTFTSLGKLGTEMPAWSKVLSDQEIANVSEHVFKAFIEPGQPRPDKTPASK